MAKGTLTREPLPLQFAEKLPGENSKARRKRLYLATAWQRVPDSYVKSNGGHSDPTWEEVCLWIATLSKKRAAKMLRLTRDERIAAYARAMVLKDHNRDVARQNAESLMPKFRKPKSRKARERVQEHQHDSTLQGYPYMASPTGGAMSYVNYNNHMGYKLT